jgi:hypothetical protein
VGLVAAVDRRRQRQAIVCHISQSADKPMLWRRLELSQDSSESLRAAVRTPEHTAPASPDFDGGAS